MRFLIIGVVFIFTQQLSAQTTSLAKTERELRDPFILKFQLAAANPLNEFAEMDTVREAYFGMGGDLAFRIGRASPIRLGIGLEYYWMGTRNQNISFVDDVGDSLDLESKVRGSMLPIHVHLRLDPGIYTDFPIIPYVGGIAGMRIFNVNRKFTYTYQNGSEPYKDNNRKINITGSYGFELGTYIRLNDEVRLDFSYVRALGGNAKYIDVSSISFDGAGNSSYSYLESKTDVEMFQFGVSVVL